MRFKKGSEIEVWNKREVLSGSWWPAELLSGNGHTYCVRYERPQCEDDQPIMERVPRKAIRPRPPLVGGAENWMPGVVVEVFDSNSWKTARILKVVRGGNWFIVKLLGSSREFGVYAHNVRVRQSWVDNQWVLIGEASRSYEDGEANGLPPGRCYEKLKYQEPHPDVTAKVHVGDSQLVTKNHIDFQETQRLSSRSLKRGSQLCTSQIEPNLGARQKMRVIEKDGRRKRWAPGSPSPLLEKVDAVASPGKTLGDNYMHASFNRMSRSSDMNMRESPNGDDKCLTRNLEPDDACSVASCNTTNPSPSISPYQYRKDVSSDTGSHFGNTESSSGQDYGRKCSFLSKEELAAEIHKLELHAYRSTMKALYASGPLSWEQEAMMTNLRLSLNISNDEHLLELRHLVSAKQT
ncbi:EMSY N-terminal [Cinnamomum micranthum f. kanehirae]|uniref:EMSY N-terminal n=1 Tax=Cinnamomum micranthum f. kanehirae TaxID=337451 RepID=A0A3S3PRY4_9MAGN|nr:EMSY N-terminal [Cinnamomum micranthum f. kanehirae]